MKRPTLTVAIITKNEILNIEECLQSIAWADEIVIVDSGSTDGTLDVARRLGAKVISTADWPGFGPQKNRALREASCDWILSIDADERVTSDLRQALEQAIASNEDAAFETPRLTHFLGKPVRHCGWYPDFGTRLFKRGAGVFSDDLVHERLIIDHPRKRLQPALLHYSYRTQDDVDKKIALYGQAGAQQLAARNKRVSAITRWVKTIWAWIRTYVIRLGVLDGTTGLQIARMNALTTYRKYKPLSDQR